MQRLKRCQGKSEKYGSGIRRIVEYFAKAQLPQPEFRNISEGFMVTVFSNNHYSSKAEISSQVGDKVGDKVGEFITKNQSLILNNIQSNPNITAQELALIAGISKRKIEENLSKLKKLNKLKRIGPAKGGHWEIVKSEK